MTTKAKTPNYTAEMLDAMIAAYTAVRQENEDMRSTVVADLAAKYHKSPRGVIAKLAAETIEVDGKPEKLYISKVKTSAVTGGEAQKKDALAAELVNVSGLNLVSAVKINKTDLVALIKFAEVANSMAREYADLVEFVVGDMEQREAE